MHSLSIYTERLLLIAGTAQLTKLAITNEHDFSNELGAKIPENWPEELMIDAQPRVAEWLESDPGLAGWSVWYVILRKHDETKQDHLIGTVGLAGRPTADGTVEFGWGILEQFRSRGYATEAAKALMEWVFRDKRVTNITAQTFPHLKGSVRVMEKCGLTHVGESCTVPGAMLFKRVRPLSRKETRLFQ